MNMSVNIAGVEWKNPVTVASGTFGSGEEFSEFVDIKYATYKSFEQNGKISFENYIKILIKLNKDDQFLKFLNSFEFDEQKQRASSKKIDENCKKIIPVIAYGMTDETFSIVSLTEGKIKAEYILTVEFITHMSWYGFSVLGYIFGEFLPEIMSMSMGIADLWVRLIMERRD